MNYENLIESNLLDDYIVIVNYIVIVFGSFDNEKFFYLKLKNVPTVSTWLLMCMAVGPFIQF